MNPRCDGGRGFTLVELLTVLAIIVLLAGIMLPTTSQARVSARRARTKLQFVQWAAAIELFRDEYGGYPVFASEAKVNAGAMPGGTGVHLFHDILAGRRRDGSPLPDFVGAGSGTIPPPEAQNRRGIAFLRFGAAEVFGADAPAPELAGLLHDDFGGTDLAVMVDRNQDGWINEGDYPQWPPVSPPDAPDRRLVPAEPIAAGIRASVLLYSAPPGAKTAGELVRNVP